LSKAAVPRIALTSDKKQKLDGKMDKYVRLICGWIYDPTKGDPVGDIRPGIPFEKLPDNWVCPQCGAPKNQFEKVK
jgi:rubredoxin